MEETGGSERVDVVWLEEPAISSAALVRFAGDANDAPYSLLTVIDEKCYGAGAWGEPRRVAALLNGELAGLAVISGAYVRLLAVRRDLRRRGIGRGLLRRCEEAIRAAGSPRVVIAGEPGNYFVPGVEEHAAATLSFFERRGYVRGELAQNMEAALERLPEVSVREGVTVERAGGSTQDEIIRYVTAEFGRLWAFEVSPAFSDRRPPLFIARAGGDIIGFSAHDVNNRGLGFYGPAGVTRSWRGGGIGALLLRASLDDLIDRGYARVIIPWVSSVEFYGRIARAVSTHRFVGLQKSL